MKNIMIIWITMLTMALTAYGDDNRVPNGGFEEWTTPSNVVSWIPGIWAVSNYPIRESSDVYAGNYSGEWKWSRQDNGENPDNMSKSGMFPVVEGQRLRLQATFKPLTRDQWHDNGQIEILMFVADSTTGAWKMALKDDDGNPAKVLLWWGDWDTNVVVGSDYVTKSVDFTVPALAPNRSGRLYMLNRYWRGGRILLDAVSVAPPPPAGTVVIVK